MRILLSAYGCEPHRGSEFGIGWNWAISLASLGHDVLVLTQDTIHKKEIIAKELKSLPQEIISRLEFIYYDFEPGGKRDSRAQTFERGRQIIWQFLVFSIAKDLHEKEPFDLIHHITWGSIRYGSRLQNLNTPFVYGPLGSGERAPYNLRRGYSLIGHIKDFVRDISNLAIRVDPSVQNTIKNADLIIARTSETQSLIPMKFQDKCLVRSDLGIDEKQFGAFKLRDRSARKFLFAGRLLHWKGLNVTISAFAKACEICDDLTFTIVGDGPEKQKLQRIAKRLNVFDKIQFINWVPQNELMALYREHDVFLFTSLHDSGGTVLLEAFGNGMPVISLKLGGPGLLVDNNRGFLLEVKGRSWDQVVNNVADRILELHQNKNLFLEKQKNAFEWSKENTWISNARETYEIINEKLNIES